MSTGRQVKKVTKAKYLGVMLEERADPNTEINERIKQASVTWNRLYKYWKLGKCSIKRKLHVWNAVIRSKLLYALTTVQINKDKANRLDAFQAKGIRRILGWKTTYIERENTNKKLRKTANKILNEGKPEYKKSKQYERLSKRIKRDRIRYLGHLFREEKNEPTRKAIIIAEHTPNLGWRKRIGRPRNNWLEETMRDAWNTLRAKLPYGKRKHKDKRIFNLADKKCRLGLLLGARHRIFYTLKKRQNQHLPADAVAGWPMASRVASTLSCHPTSSAPTLSCRAAEPKAKRKRRRKNKKIK